MSGEPADPLPAYNARWECSPPVDAPCQCKLPIWSVIMNRPAGLPAGGVTSGLSEN